MLSNDGLENEEPYYTEEELQEMEQQDEIAARTA